MSEPTDSPLIREIAWGRVTVEGASTPFKDVKLFPGGAREWDWNETGTRHEPGIQPADVQELLDHGAREIVLGRGMYERLNVRPDTLELLESKAVPVHVMETRRAVERYNELTADRPVGALIHSTC